LRLGRRLRRDQRRSKRSGEGWTTSPPLSQTFSHIPPALDRCTVPRCWTALAPVSLQDGFAASVRVAWALTPWRVPSSSRPTEHILPCLAPGLTGSRSRRASTGPLVACLALVGWPDYCL
jgi:hypothetical protein